DPRHQGHPREQQEPGERPVLGAQAGRQRLHRETVSGRRAAHRRREVLLMDAQPFDSDATLLEAVSVADAQFATSDGLGEPSSGEPVPDAPQATRFVLFTIAETCYGVPEVLVTELDRVPKITPVPNVPA